jgi:hemolysin D
MSQLDAAALDFAPGILAIQEAPPSPLPRIMLYVLSALIAILVAWAMLGRVDVIATAEGKLVPQSYLKIVQPADSGILKEILVKEGDQVEAGQTLLRLDAQLSQADTRIVEAEVQQKTLQLRRIDAELADSPLLMKKGDDAEAFRQVNAQYLAHRQAYRDAIAQEEATRSKAREDLAGAEQVQRKLAQVLPAYQETESAWNRLGQEGFAGKLMVMEKQRDRIEKEQDLKAQHYTIAGLQANLAQSDKRIAQITSNYRQQLHNERVEAQGQLEKASQELAKQKHKNALLELKAPQAGIIKDLATHTLGTVVSPGTILLTLVPANEPLQAEVMVKNEDVGFVHAGQAVKVKLAAYPFQKYGMVEGKVIHVGADASEGQGQAGGQTNARGAVGQDGTQTPTTYKAIVRFERQYLTADGEKFELTPGMQVVAEVNQGDRTVMDYLLSPVQKAFREAGRER